MPVRVSTIGYLSMEQAENAHTLRVKLSIDEGGERESAVDAKVLGREGFSL